MEDNASNRDLTANGFFRRARISSTSSEESYRDELRDQVAQSYLNYKEKTPEHKGRRLPRLSLVLIAIFFMLTLIVAAVFLLGGNKEQSDTKFRARITYSEGKLFHKNPSGNWETAYRDLWLEQGSTIAVNGEGRATLSLDDGSFLRLNSDTSLTLSTLTPEAILITLDYGDVYARVQPASRPFELVASGIVYRALGTAFRSYCLGELEGTTLKSIERNGVEVFESQVRVIGASEQLVQEGESYFVINSYQPELEKKLGKIEVAQLEKDEFLMWNKDEDEKVAAFKEKLGVLSQLSGPRLTLASPATGEETTAEQILVSGSSDPDCVIFINGYAASNNNGSFSYQLALEPGLNEIKVVATDRDGNKTVRSVSVTRKELATETPTASSTPTPTASGLVLFGTQTSKGVTLNWNVYGLDVSKGFKLVRSLNANPIYPGDTYIYLTDRSQRSYTWEIMDGKTYHFRICQYNGSGACLSYSNDITVAAPSPVPTTPPATDNTP